MQKKVWGGGITSVGVRRRKRKRKRKKKKKKKSKVRDRKVGEGSGCGGGGLRRPAMLKSGWSNAGGPAVLK